MPMMELLKPTRLSSRTALVAMVAVADSSEQLMQWMQGSATDSVGIAKNDALTNNNAPRKPNKAFHIHGEIEQTEVRAYATIYGVHPSLIKSTHTGIVQMQTPCNPYTSKSQRSDATQTNATNA